ncbi:hypothetical protein BT96DRAFT_960430 [Gymnopus androsaceus JB14]|uniref:Helitron helicase-like domain-containing protein n=1 Tax=Gymnopus androsaceus JB14 TaxID=1447944 RepID=A0A6A4GPU9_9AGAR|nr:hypothetical protein BT96DRAFT_960430 [Gymnopus androsaceus JB14]
MFPTLFPLGIGGFEDSGRSPTVSLESHAKHLLDSADRAFRYHYFYVFVVLNLIQRRKAHLHTSLSIKSSRFSTVAPALLSVHPDHNPLLFTSEEKSALLLLKEVNTISSKVPGSQASKVHARHEIRSYFSHFGLPTLFFTFNPSAMHSPIFQVIFGNDDIDLDTDHPTLPSTRSARARNVAKDPVAGADFFEFMRTCLFQDLFGWDFKAGKSSDNGGIFGKIRAHYGSAELTERDQFHGRSVTKDARIKKSADSDTLTISLKCPDMK